MSAHLFNPGELLELRGLAERIENDVKWAGRRLVVEVWDEHDTEAVAWIEMHPSDSNSSVRFGPDEEGE